VTERGRFRPWPQQPRKLDRSATYSAPWGLLNICQTFKRSPDEHHILWRGVREKRGRGVVCPLAWTVCCPGSSSKAPTFLPNRAPNGPGDKRTNNRPGYKEMSL